MRASSSTRRTRMRVSYGKNRGHLTPFQPPAECDLWRFRPGVRRCRQIHDICGALVADACRNDMIVEALLRALFDGRSPLLLTAAPSTSITCGSAFVD